MNDVDARRDEAEARVRHFLATGGEWPARTVVDPVPGPKEPYRMNGANDRRFLKSLRIDPEG